MMVSPLACLKLSLLEIVISSDVYPIFCISDLEHFKLFFFKLDHSISFYFCLAFNISGNASKEKSKFSSTSSLFIHKNLNNYFHLKLKKLIKHNYTVIWIMKQKR